MGGSGRGELKKGEKRSEEKRKKVEENVFFP